jgi:hypothetical protein
VGEGDESVERSDRVVVARLAKGPDLVRKRAGERQVWLLKRITFGGAAVMLVAKLTAKVTIDGTTASSGGSGILDTEALP